MCIWIQFHSFPTLLSPPFLKAASIKSYTIYMLLFLQSSNLAQCFTFVQDLSILCIIAFCLPHYSYRQSICYPIGLYRDVWIAAIASSRTSLATQMAAICVRFQGRRVRHTYVTMQVPFLTRKSALIYRWGLRQRVASLTLDCNGVFAIKAYCSSNQQEQTSIVWPCHEE